MEQIKHPRWPQLLIVLAVLLLPGLPVGAFAAGSRAAGPPICGAQPRLRRPVGCRDPLRPAQRHGRGTQDLQRQRRQ